MFAEQLVLLAHGDQILHLAIARCEVVVPQQSQPLAQRIGREQHAVEPPGLEPVGIVRGLSRVADGAGHLLEVRRRGVGSRLARQQSVDGGRRAICYIVFDFSPTCSKCRPAVQMDHALAVPRRCLGRLVGFPSGELFRSHRHNRRNKKEFR
jgi:hypothetical protein